MSTPESDNQFGAAVTVYSALSARFEAGPDPLVCGVLINNGKWHALIQAQRFAVIARCGELKQQKCFYRPAQTVYSLAHSQHHSES